MRYEENKKSPARLCYHDNSDGILTYEYLGSKKQDYSE